VCDRPNQLDAAACGWCGRPLPDPRSRPPAHAAATIRRARRIFVVLVALLAALATIAVLTIRAHGGDGADPRPFADAADKTADGVYAAMEASVPKGSELGPGWTALGPQVVPRSKLATSDLCPREAARPTPPRAAEGFDYSYGLAADGAEAAHLTIVITEFADPASATAHVDARGRPEFAPCLRAASIGDITAAGGTDVHEDALTPLGHDDSGALRFLDRSTYRYRGATRTAYEVTGYATVGRFVVTMTAMRCCTPPATAWFDGTLDTTMEHLARFTDGTSQP
jgi:hypothetical protein